MAGGRADPSAAEPAPSELIGMPRVRTVHMPSFAGDLVLLLIAAELGPIIRLLIGADRA